MGAGSPPRRLVAARAYGRLGVSTEETAACALKGRGTLTCSLNTPQGWLCIVVSVDQRWVHRTSFVPSVGRQVQHGNLKNHS